MRLDHLLSKELLRWSCLRVWLVQRPGPDRSRPGWLLMGGTSAMAVGCVQRCVSTSGVFGLLGWNLAVLWVVGRVGTLLGPEGTARMGCDF